MRLKNQQTGVVAGSILIIAGLSLLSLALAAFGIWSYMQYSQQKTDVDGKITAAVAEAKKTQADSDEAKFAEREKQPLRQFVGPDDYGRLTFDYPKTWSAYQATDVSKGGGVTYRAYLNPVVVPPVSDTQKFALRVTIEQVTYDQALKSYESLLKSGALQSSVFKNANLTGTRLDGNFSKDIRGSAIVVKMRDRTLTIRTDADVFKPDFEALIKTVNFNQ